MRREIQQITEIFNKKIKTISLEKIQMYQRLMQYRREVYAYERDKESNRLNTEILNPNKRYTKIAQIFFKNPNLTIEEILQLVENETREVKELCYDDEKANNKLLVYV